VGGRGSKGEVLRTAIWRRCVRMAGSGSWLEPVRSRGVERRGRYVRAGAVAAGFKGRAERESERARQEDAAMRAPVGRDSGRWRRCGACGSHVLGRNTCGGKRRAAETNFPASSWFSASTFPQSRNLLSGRWLSAIGKRGKEECSPSTRWRRPGGGGIRPVGAEVLAARAVPMAVGSGNWRTCNRDMGWRDNTPLKDGVCANWVNLARRS